MESKTRSKTDILKLAVHWAFMPYYVYEFGYASLAKIFQYPHMIDSMASLGFNTVWTLVIGYAELIGWAMVLIGLFRPGIRVMGILFLLPFSIGAFTAHMAHQEYEHFYPSLIMCISSVILLWSAKSFNLKIR